MASRAIEIEDVKTGEVTEAVYEHPFVVRLCHWVNAVSVRDGRQRISDLSSFPELRSKDPAKRSSQLAQGLCARWMAGRRAAMAPYLHVDLYRDRLVVHRLPDLQRKLQAGTLYRARPAWRVANGAPLLFLRPQAAGQGSLQPATEARIHVRVWFRSE